MTSLSVGSVQPGCMYCGTLSTKHEPGSVSVSVARSLFPSCALLSTADSTSAAFRFSFRFRLFGGVVEFFLAFGLLFSESRFAAVLSSVEGAAL